MNRTSKTYVPRVTGRNAQKLNRFFREDKSFPEGHSSRYPLGEYSFPVHIKFSNVSTETAGALIINERKAIINSANKLKTFDLLKGQDININKAVPASRYVLQVGGETQLDVERLERDFPYPFVAKLVVGDKKRGFYKINNIDDLAVFCERENLSKYLFEEYFSFDREFRIHVSPWLKDHSMTYAFPSNGRKKIITNKDGVILMARKLIRNGSNESINNRENNDNITFSTNFQIEGWMEVARTQAVKAAKLLGLDFAAMDVGYNSSTGEFRFFESNSNPGMDDMTGICYQKAFKSIILIKAEAKKFRIKSKGKTTIAVPPKKAPKKILIKYNSKLPAKAAVGKKWTK